jgi:hypothetical protein
MILASTFLIFFAAIAGVGFFTIQTFRFLGQALNKRRPIESRRMSALISAASAVAIVLSSAGGFVGISSVWFAAQKSAIANAPEQQR